MPDPRLPDTKKFNPKDPNPCAGCSQCCEYIALGLDYPTTVKDFDEILWFIIHRDVWIYIDDENDWYIQFNTPCEKLDNMRCGYYPNRPNVCRDYEPKDCVRYGDGDEPEKYMFKNEVDLFRYLAKKRPKMYKKLKKKLDLPYSKKELLDKNFGKIHAEKMHAQL